MSDLVFNGPAEFEMDVFVINDENEATGRATIGLGTFEYPSKEKVAERISKFESEEMPKGFRLMTKTEAWEMVMREKTGTSFAMAGSKEWDPIAETQSDWVSIKDTKLETGANYWLKTKDGLVLTAVATYDGINFTNGLWPVAVSLIAEVIKLTPPKAGA